MQIKSAEDLPAGYMKRAEAQFWGEVGEYVADCILKVYVDRMQCRKEVCVFVSRYIVVFPAPKI